MAAAIACVALAPIALLCGSSSRARATWCMPRPTMCAKPHASPSRMRGWPGAGGHNIYPDKLKALRVLLADANFCPTDEARLRVLQG